MGWGGTADQWDGARLIDEKIETRSGGGAELRGGWGEEGAKLVVIEMESSEID